MMPDQSTLDPDKENMLNQLLMNQIGGRPGGIPSSGVPSTPPASGGLPPATPPDLKTQATPESKIETSHPGLQSDELTPYLKGQEAQATKFGPEQQAAVMQHLQQSYRSPGNVIAKGGATLADAIMQGVARAGSSGNLAAINERENQQLNRTAEMGKNLQEQKLKVLETQQGLEAQSPTTPLGAASMPMLQAVGKMYGLGPDAIKAMARTNPQTAMKLLDKYSEFASTKEKVAIEQEMKLLEIQVQQANAQAMQGIARQGKDIEAKKTTQEAAKAVLGGSSIPFVGPSHAQKQAAANELAGNAGVAGQFSPDVTAYAQKHGITPEQAQAIKDKRTAQ